MSKRRSYLVPTVFLICVALVLAGCIAEKPDEERQVQGEGTSGPIPIQVEPTDLPPTAAPTEGAAILPTDTPSSYDQISPTDTPEAVPDEPTTAPVIDETVEIQLDWDIYSIELGEEEEIGVQVLSSGEEAIPFSIQTDGDCLTAAFDMDSITITAGDELCEQVITVKAANAEDKTLKVIVFDPMVMDIGDGLLIRYVNSYKWMWDATGMDDANYPNFYFWHPNANSKAFNTNYPDGWYSLGSVFVNTNDPSAVPAIVVKDSKNAGLLAPPEDYEKIWEDTGSGQTAGDTSIWKPICPNGFVSIGVIANNSHSIPDTDAMRCIRKTYTVQGQVANWIWDSGGSDCHTAVNIYSIGYQEGVDIPDGKAILPTSGAVACKTDDWTARQCDQSLANILLVPLPVYKSSSNETQPKLDGPKPLNTKYPLFFSSIRVPFTLIDSEYLGNSEIDGASFERIKTNIEFSPFYYVQREEIYKSIEVTDNRGSPNPHEWQVTYTTGFSTEESSKFTREVGIEVSVGGDVSFLGSGGNWSVTLSTKFGWEKSVSYTQSIIEEKSHTWIVPPGVYAEVLQVTSQFRAIPMTTNISCNSTAFNMSSNIITYIQYPPPD